MNQSWKEARNILRLVAADLAPELGARGVGLRLSDNVDLVGMVALSRLCPDLGDHDAVSTQAPVCVSLMSHAHELSKAIGREVRRRTRLPVRDSQLSERIASRLGASVRATGEVPDETETDDLVATLAQWWTEREEQLTEEEFVAAASGRYARAWLQTGARSLSEHPPSTVLLGHDERPPVVAATSRSPRWLQGTDRSVYDRYRNHFDSRASSRVGAKHQHRCSWDSPPRPRGDEVEHSITSTCEPYGLLHVEHRTLLEIAVMCATGGPVNPRSRAAFVDWNAHCAPMPVVKGSLHDWVWQRAAAHYDTFWRGPEGAALRREWGWDLSQFLNEIQMLLSRRAWQDLARREREHLHPVALCSADRVLKIAVRFGVGGMLGRVLRGETTIPSSPAAERVNATWQLVLRHTPPQDEASRGEEQLVGRYRELLGATDEHAKEGYLTVDEFVTEVRGWLRPQEPARQLTGIHDGSP